MKKKETEWNQNRIPFEKLVKVATFSSFQPKFSPLISSLVAC